MKCRRQKAELRSQKSEIRGRIFTAVTSSFCILPSKFCLSSPSGQALIEFTVALVAIMVVVVGTLLLNKIELAHTWTMTSARATAGELALGLIYRGSIDARFIADWQPGADNIRYTHDDEADLDAAAITLVGDITANAGLDDIPSSLATNAITRLSSSPTPLSEFYLVKGSESKAIALGDIPGFCHLISSEQTLSVESEAYLVWAEGIY